MVAEPRSRLATGADEKLLAGPILPHGSRPPASRPLAAGPTCPPTARPPKWCGLEGRITGLTGLRAWRFAGYLGLPVLDPEAPCGALKGDWVCSNNVPTAPCTRGVQAVGEKIAEMTGQGIR
jgi:hypothetical protein